MHTTTIKTTEPFTFDHKYAVGDRLTYRRHHGGGHHETHTVFWVGVTDGEPRYIIDGLPYSVDGIDGNPNWALVSAPHTTTLDLDVDRVIEHKYRVGQMLQWRGARAPRIIGGVRLHHDEPCYVLEAVDRDLDYIMRRVEAVDREGSMWHPVVECAETWWNIYPTGSTGSHPTLQQAEAGAVASAPARPVARVHRARDGVVTVTDLR